MKKKYFEPEIDFVKIERCCITSSGGFSEGDSIWNNETPLVPIK